MTTQPEALQLADALDNALVYGLRGRQAAAELRRQHAVIAELLVALKIGLEIYEFDDDGVTVPTPKWVARSRAAIARAEEAKP